MFENFVVAKEITTNFNFKLYDAEDKAIALKNRAGTNNYTETGINYSVESYCKGVISTSSNEKMVTFAKSLLDYGHTAALYLPDYSADVSGLDLYQKDKVAAVTLSDVENYKAVKYTFPSDVTLSGVTLNLESDTSIRLYFNGNVTGHTFTCSETTLTPESGLLTISNIAAKDLDESYMIQADGTDMMSIPAMFWSRSVLKSSSSSDAAIMMAKTFYLYNQAANDYFA
jgi:hypothetical protein